MAKQNFLKNGGVMANGAALAGEELCISRDDGKRPPFRLEDINLRLDAGSLVVLQSGSGGGKSTLLLALARLITLDSGSLSLDGVSAPSCPPPAWRARVNLVPAEPAMVEGTIGENLLLPWAFKANRSTTPPDTAAISEGMAQLGLGGIDAGAGARSLSTGQTARVALLRHLLVGPPYLLLDEPTASLDPEAAKLVWQALAAYIARTGAGVLAVTHHKGHAKPDQLLRIKNGRLERG